jgi:uncharacterized protein
MWTDFLTAVALVFVIEGIMPFCNPAGLRKMFILISGMDDSKLRFIGLTSMVFGLLLLYLVR